MNYHPADMIQDNLVFGEFGEVNPSISDASTFTFLTAEKMTEVFNHEIEGCFLYSRHVNPMNDYLARVLAMLEGTEAAQMTSSGMSAINCSIMQICNSGDEIVSSRIIYGGTYALMKNFLPKFGIQTKFVNIVDVEEVEKSITEKTKIIYTETLSNPLLEVADIAALRKIADKYNLYLIVDNTFSPMIVSPHKLGAHIVADSITKFINGASDCISGVICSTHEFIASLRDVHSGACMLLGPTQDSARSASIFKNIRTLSLRMQQHSKNAMFVAKGLKELGLKVYYPGLETHPQHQLMKSMLNDGYGYGGMVTFDADTGDKANQLMIKMQEQLVGYFAVSLGFYKTLFSSPGRSTSSEIPEDEQKAIGLTEGLVRMSVGLDNNIERSFDRMKNCMREVGLI